MNILQEFRSESVLRMEESAGRIAQCLAHFNEESVWQRPSPALSSMGNLVLHLCGNITQYILSSLGGQPDHRERDGEFAASGGYTCIELSARMTAVINAAVAVIATAPDAELARVRSVQCFEMTGMAIVIHVVEHLSYHTGQIAFYTKLLHGADLGFYAHAPLNTTV